VALSGGGEGRTASACGVEHTENSAAVFSLRPQANFGSQSLWMGGAESFLHNRCKGSKGSAQCGSRHSNIWRLGFHPHLHILVSDGCFQKNGMFSVSPAVDTEALEQIFRSKVPS